MSLHKTLTHPMSTIQNLALGMKPNTSQRTNCPYCRSKEQSFSITRIDEGAVYLCFRASCSKRGFVRLAPGNQGLVPGADSVRRPSVFGGTVAPLSTAQRQYLLKKFPWLNLVDLDKEQIALGVEHQELVIPLIHPCTHGRVGTMTRYYEDMPRTTETWIKPSTKTRIFWEGPAVDNLAARACMPLTSKKLHPTTHIVAVVEDFWSAMRLGRYIPTIPLLGTNITLATITCVAGDDLLICLDGDATNKAIDLANKYSALFNSVRVVSLKGLPDIKDMQEKDLDPLVVSMLGHQPDLSA